MVVWGVCVGEKIEAWGAEGVGKHLTIFFKYLSSLYEWTSQLTAHNAMYPPVYDGVNPNGMGTSFCGNCCLTGYMNLQYASVTNGGDPHQFIFTPIQPSTCTNCFKTDQQAHAKCGPKGKTF